MKRDKFKVKNVDKTFIWHNGKKHGQFKIDRHYNIISGKYEGKHYRDIIKEVDKMFMFHGSASIAFLEWVK